MKPSECAVVVIILFACNLMVTAGEQTKSQIKSAGYQTDIMMMPYYTGTILPTPQQVKYEKSFLSLDRTGIILADDIEKTDGRLSYLLDRINRYGGEYEFITPSMNQDKTCLIYIGNTQEAEDLSVPAKPQGYLIKSDRKKIILKAYDHQGLLWAISSLNQMIRIDDHNPQVQMVQVVDWPETLQRGFLGGRGMSEKPEIISHFMVAYKFNLVDFRDEITKDKQHQGNWRLPRSDIFHERITEIGRRFKTLGFRWYAGSRFLGWGQIPQINCSSEKDFGIIYKNFALPIAKAGGGLSVQFDDTRFPLHPDDQKKF